MKRTKSKITPSPRLETNYERKQRERQEALELTKNHQDKKPIKYLLK